MLEKKSKVTKCDFKKEFTGNHGTNYYFNVEFENGDKGEASSKERDQIYFAVGKEIDYTINPRVVGSNTYYDIRKPQAAKGGANWKPQAAKGNESFALSYAKDVQVAHIVAGKEFKTEAMLQVADKLFDWLESKKK